MNIEVKHWSKTEGKRSWSCRLKCCLQRNLHKKFNWRLDLTTKVIVNYYRIRNHKQHTQLFGRSQVCLFRDNDSRIRGTADTFRCNLLKIYTINYLWAHLLCWWTQAAITPSKIWRSCYPTLSWNCIFRIWKLQQINNIFVPVN